MSFVVDNDSVNFGGIITGDITLTSWGRLIYTVYASSDITITLPPEPKPNNIVESGSISFIRVDSDANYTVTVVVDIGGFPNSYKIYPNPLDVHKFKTIYDPSNQLAFTTLYSVDVYGVVEGSERVLRDVVDTVATTDQNAFASNYIGLNINGVTLAAGDSLLLTAQGNEYQNGAYKVNTNGTISYRDSEPLGMDGRYHVFPVKRGDYSGYSYRVTNSVNPLAPALYDISSLKIEQYEVPATFDTGADLAVIITAANSPYQMTGKETVVNVVCNNNEIIFVYLPAVDSVSANNKSKRFTFNRLDNSSGSLVYIEREAGTSDFIMRRDSPIGTSLTFIPLESGSTVSLRSIQYTGLTYLWAVESDSNSSLYGSILHPDEIDSSVLVAPYQGYFYTVNAVSGDIEITLPDSSVGAGSKKFSRIDNNAQFNVALVAAGGHTVNGLDKVYLYPHGTATVRVVEKDNPAQVVELSQTFSTQEIHSCKLYGIPNTDTNAGYIPIDFSPSNISDRVKLDPNNMHDDNVDPTRVKIYQRGIYQIDIDFSIKCSHNSDIIVALWKNGSVFRENIYSNFNYNHSGTSLNIITELLPNDFLEMYVSTSQSGAYLSAFLSVTLLKRII